MLFKMAQMAAKIEKPEVEASATKLPADDSCLLGWALKKEKKRKHAHHTCPAVVRAFISPGYLCLQELNIHVSRLWQIDFHAPLSTAMVACSQGKCKSIPESQ